MKASASGAKMSFARIAGARQIWDAGKDPRGTLAEMYLRKHRKLDLPDVIGGGVLRFHPRCPWRNENTGKTEYVPALIVVFRSIDRANPSLDLERRGPGGRNRTAHRRDLPIL